MDILGKGRLKCSAMNKPMQDNVHWKVAAVSGNTEVQQQNRNNLQEQFKEHECINGQ